MARGTDDSILVVIQITRWIKEIFQNISYHYSHKQEWECWVMAEVCVYQALFVMSKTYHRLQCFIMAEQTSRIQFTDCYNCP